MDLDLLVIGSGPSGQRAAIQAAKLGKRVAVVERRERLGGVSIHTGTIPSKTLREAVLDELARRPLDVPDPIHPEHRERAALAFLMDRAAHVVGAEAAVVREQLRRNSVGVLFGDGTLVDEHTFASTTSTSTRRSPRRTSCSPSARCRPGRRASSSTTSRHRLRRPAAPPAPAAAEHDDRRRRRHRHRVRVDARRLGTKVTVVDQRPRVLPFLDGEIGEAFQYLLRRATSRSASTSASSRSSTGRAAAR